MLIVWLFIVLIFLEALYQGILYFYKLSDKNKISPLVLDFVESRKRFLVSGIKFLWMKILHLE